MSSSNPSYELPLSPHLHLLDETEAGAYKACRRGLEEDALYAAAKLQRTSPTTFGAGFS